MAINSVSFLGQSQAQIARLKNINAQMADLQRQITTQKKTDTFAGLGSKASTVQLLRADTVRAERYLDNIDVLTTRMDVMSDVMSRVTEMGRQLVDSIIIQVRDGEVEIDTIRMMAKDSLAFVQDLINTQYDGRYLFAASDTGNKPYIDALELQNNMSAQVSSWLNGSQDGDTLINNVQNLHAQNLGFSPTISTGGAVRMQIDDNLDIDYTVRGDIDGFQEIVRALSLAANMEYPNPNDHLATTDDFNQVLNQIMAMANHGVDLLSEANMRFSSKSILIQSVKETHIQDKAQMQVMTAEIENADTTEAILILNALQTQLTASYQVTGMLSQMSLANYLSG